MRYNFRNIKIYGVYIVICVSQTINNILAVQIRNFAFQDPASHPEVPPAAAQITV